MRHQILGEISGAEFLYSKKIPDKIERSTTVLKIPGIRLVFGSFDPHSLIYKQNACDIRNQHKKLSLITCLLTKESFYHGDISDGITKNSFLQKS
jgi:hypothetical protein